VNYLGELSNSLLSKINDEKHNLMRIKICSKILLHEVGCELGILSHVLVRILTLHELTGSLLLKIDIWDLYLS
jgi:hypothetical protein